MTPREIELATIQSWPAAVTEAHDGWRYLASGGVTGRVNAVWPIDVQSKKHVEAARKEIVETLLLRLLP